MYVYKHTNIQKEISMVVYDINLNVKSRCGRRL